MMAALELVPAYREHELPVAWDGEPIQWGEAVAVGSVFVCPPPRPRACPECGQLDVAGADSYVGKVPGEPVAPYWIRDRVTGRPRKMPGWETWRPRLVLTRCLGCGHDQVHDLDTDETWDLDETDYGPQGSVHPEQLQGTLW